VTNIAADIFQRCKAVVFVVLFRLPFSRSTAMSLMLLMWQVNPSSPMNYFHRQLPSRTLLTFNAERSDNLFLLNYQQHNLRHANQNHRAPEN
jgi:hypothetical protein